LNFAAAASHAADKIALQLKCLSFMLPDRAISLTPLRPNGGQARAKSWQETGVFDLIPRRLKYLHVIFANLSGLRRRRGEPRAK
jgi:hypothetical protein